MRRRRLLTIAHSYVVALNRRLASELARAGGEQWDVTALAPTRFRGDLREIGVESSEGELSSLVRAPAYGTRSVHLFCYGPSLRRTLRDEWDFVHLWEEPYVAAGAQVAAWLPRAVPLAFATFQNIRKTYPPPFRQFEQFVLSRSRGWIAGGQTVATALGGSAGYRDRPFTTIPLGVDVEVFRPDSARRAEAYRRLAWIDGDAPVVGYLGRFVKEKGLSFLMSALDDARPTWRALFVGAGPLEGEVRAWAARHGDRVRVVPAVHHDEVPLYLSAMDLLCAPSETTRKWHEQLGRMIIEAFACGVAVVGSDSGEIPFTIGDAGCVVRERDHQAWVAALSALLESPARRLELAARGRERAASHFAWPVIARRTLGFLSELGETRRFSE